ncbi:MAG: hypothetical protein Kow00127_19760 [Bacteroidales bacterium]
MLRFIPLFLFLVLNTLTAQDTLTLLQYNLLMYGNNFGGCNNSNNNVQEKNEALRTIVEYVKPDLVFVNELDEESYYHDLILNDVFNVDGTALWARGSVSNLGNSYTVNQAYYRTDKVELSGYTAVQTNVRDIDIFRFSVFSSTGNPAELNCCVAHLKAGSDPDNVQERGYEANKLMNYLNNSASDGNYTFSGDFNLYSASEPAWENLLNYANADIRFYDPLNRPGNWNNNPAFADIHTQSTHYDGNCFSGGGMDDRFDFFLLSEEVLLGSERIQYLEGSYHALGQDGQHFNLSITSSPLNTSVPAEVLQALYQMSDHLPVVIRLVIDPNLSIAEQTGEPFNFRIGFTAPKQLTLTPVDASPGKYQAQIVNMTGNVLKTSSWSTWSGAEWVIDAGRLPTGFYLMVIEGQQGTAVRKIIID